MSKKWIFLTIVIVLGIGTGMFVLATRKNNSSESLVNLTSTKDGNKEIEFITYEHSSGFSFEYPESVEITDSTSTNDYANLDLQHDGNSGSISFTDTKLKAIDQGSLELVGSVVFGGIAANQYSDQTSLITMAIDQGVLYKITTPKSWNEIHTRIVETFAFAGTEPKKTSGTSTTQTIYEEEEIVE